MDGLLLVGGNVSELVERIVYMLNVCLKKEIKLSPKKMQLGKKVVFWGISICYDNFLDVVDISPEESKLAAVKNLKIP